MANGIGYVKLILSGVEIAELANSIGVSTAYVSEVLSRINESNPMLGHRGVRLGISYPEIYEMQVSAIFKAAHSIYLEDKTKVNDVIESIKEIKDIEVVLTKDEGCNTYNLPPDRMGDIICMSSEFMTIGSSEDKHNLSGLNEPLRSHGGLHEREVPFISNLKIQNYNNEKQLYNYDAFYYAINGAL